MVGAHQSGAARRLSGCCDDIKGKLFIKHEAWVTLLAKIQSENRRLKR